MDPNRTDRMHPTGGRSPACGTVPDSVVVAPIDTVDALVAVLELNARQPEHGPRGTRIGPGR